MGEVNFQGSSILKTQKMNLIKSLWIVVFCSLLAINAHTQNLKESDLIYYISNNADHVFSTDVLQLGNNNMAFIDGKNLTVVQQGDDQQFTYLSTSMIPSELNVHIEGHNNHVEIIGNNQIMDQASIYIQGDNRNVLIRNFP